MTAARMLGVGFVLALAIVAAPYSLPPGFNMADLILIAAPGALLLIVCRPRRFIDPAGGDAPPDAQTDSPDV
jgi:hypothetical protein